MIRVSEQKDDKMVPLYHKSLKDLKQIFKRKRERFAQISDNLNKIEVYFFTICIYNMLVAFNFNLSQQMTQYNISFRIWNFIDFGVNGWVILVITLTNAVIKRYQINSFWEVYKDHKIASVICVLTILGKMGWLFFGMFIFAEFTLQSIPDGIFEFSFFYLLGAVWLFNKFLQNTIIGLSEHFYIKKYVQKNNYESVQKLKTVVGNMQYLEKEMPERPEPGIQTSNQIGSMVNIKDQQEKKIATPVPYLIQVEEGTINPYLEDTFRNFEILWALNFFMYVKDRSQCSLLKNQFFPINYRTWNLVAGIVLVSNLVISYIFGIIRLKRRLEILDWMFFYHFFKYLGYLVTLFILGWSGYGIWYFLKQEIDDCPNKLTQLSILYFVTLLTIFFYTLYLLIKGLINLGLHECSSKWEI